VVTCGLELRTSLRSMASPGFESQLLHANGTSDFMFTLITHTPKINSIDLRMVLVIVV
jgi:hypothetical protein